LRDGVAPILNSYRHHLASQAFKAVLGGEDYWFNQDNPKHYNIWTLPDDIGADGADSVTRTDHMVMIHYNIGTKPH